jgi:hypothetical protein
MRDRDDQVVPRCWRRGAPVKALRRRAHQWKGRILLIESLELKGILSFGPDSPPLDMRPLNVLIGPNGSGKSNLLEAIDLLRSAATRLTAPMRGPGGGVREWIWKGARNGTAHIEAVIAYPAGHLRARPRAPHLHCADGYTLRLSRHAGDRGAGAPGDLRCRLDLRFPRGIRPRVLRGPPAAHGLLARNAAGNGRCPRPRQR